MLEHRATLQVDPTLFFPQLLPIHQNPPLAGGQPRPAVLDAKLSR